VTSPPRPEEAVRDRTDRGLRVALRHCLVEARDVLAEAGALEHRAVEREREVGDEIAAQPGARGLRLVGDGGRDRRDHVEPVELLAGPLASLRDLGNHDLAHVVRVAQPERHAVADLPGEPQHPRRQRTDVDR
jgi:hypothetical protein